MTGCLRTILRTMILALASLLVAAPSHAGLIVNGGFEDGFNGWTLHNQVGETSYDDNFTPPAGTFGIQGHEGLTPLSGLSTIGPNSGSSYALADATAPGVRALIQKFTAPTLLLTADLSFAMFTYDWAGFGVFGSDFDFETDFNQHVQIDLLTGDADPFATDPASIVASLFNGLPDNPLVVSPARIPATNFRGLDSLNRP